MKLHYVVLSTSLIGSIISAMPQKSQALSIPTVPSAPQNQNQPPTVPPAPTLFPCCDPSPTQSQSGSTPTPTPSQNQDNGRGGPVPSDNNGNGTSGGDNQGSGQPQVAGLSQTSAVSMSMLTTLILGIIISALAARELLKINSGQK